MGKAEQESNRLSRPAELHSEAKLTSALQPPRTSPLHDHYPLFFLNYTLLTFSSIMESSIERQLKMVLLPTPLPASRSLCLFSRKSVLLLTTLLLKIEN